MTASGKKLNPQAESDGFWQYVPDPSRTIAYLLLAVAMFAGADWIPRLAEQIEQARMQRRIDDERDRRIAEHEQWRRQHPEIARLAAESDAQRARQAELEAEAEYQLAQPNPPLPMTSSEESMPPMLN